MRLLAAIAERLPKPPSARPLRRTLALTFSVALLSAAAPLAVLSTAQPAAALGNGLALTPPMGCNDWNAYGCNVSEALVKQTADKMYTSGLRPPATSTSTSTTAGCSTAATQRATSCPDSAKFPDGIQGTADYVHSKGLKLGIYEDAGTATCAGYPGSLGHETRTRRRSRPGASTT